MSAWISGFRNRLNFRLNLSLGTLLFAVALLSLVSVVLYNWSADLVIQQFKTEQELLTPLKNIKQSLANLEHEWTQELLQPSKGLNLNWNRLKWPANISEHRTSLLEKNNQTEFNNEIRQLNDWLIRYEQAIKNAEKNWDQTPADDALEELRKKWEGFELIRTEIRNILANLEKEIERKKQTFLKEYKQSRLWFDNYQVIGLLILGVFFVLSGNYLIRELIAPFDEIREQIRSLAKGYFPPNMETQKEPFTEMASDLEKLTTRLKKMNDFSLKLSANKVQYQDIPEFENEDIKRAFSNLLDRIHYIENQESLRNWAISGHTLFSGILRKHQDLNKLCEEVCLRLTQYVQAHQSAIFIVNDTDPTNPFLEMTAAYAPDAKTLNNRNFRFGEGPVGEVANSLETYVLTDVPDDYLTLTSGLGESRPTSLLLLPLVSNDNLYGVFEIASFRKFQKEEVEFIKTVSDNLASVIGNIRNNQKTLHLLERSQELGRALKVRTEELQETNQKIQSAQFQLQRTNHQIEAQMDVLNQTTLELSQSERRFYTLLENASEIIIIFEKDQSVRYVSPSVYRILGFNPTDLLGFQFFRFIHQDDVPIVKEFLSEMPKQNKEQVLEYRFRSKNGELVYQEAFARNLIHDPSIKGIVFNTRDITERLKSEDNARRKQQFQSLIENSRDLIIRIDKHLKHQYVNPMIEQFTGFPPEFYDNRSIYDSDYSPHVISFFETMCSEVFRSKNFMKSEFTMPSLVGDKVIQVDFIPEFNLENEIVTLLIVGHDVTEMKVAERKILAQNQILEKINEEVSAQKVEIEEIARDITESIQYAKRIQEAMLPKTDILNSIVKDYFLFFQPRDIVSGDFYWILQKEGFVYVGVVDCTGHGVPGAFMAMIGFTMLNQIVNQKEITTPSKILDALQDEVLKTLSHNKEQKAQDGMDIALCKIDVNKKLIEFSGAMRPLYWWHQYDLHEVKGDKFGIGSVQIGERKPFTNHQIAYEPGDSIYLFSDGYVDQFGGDQGRKFTPSRLRDLLVKNQHKKMSDQKLVISRTFKEWKGQENQTDDVLVFGIKF